MVYEMDRVIGARINSSSGGTKVSQIANIFQNKVIGADHHQGLDTAKPKMSTSTSSLLNKKENEATTDPIPIKSEGHVNRFNNARALFEKLGTSDEKILSSSTPAPLAAKFPVSKFKSSDSLNAFPTPPTTTSVGERKATPFLLHNSKNGSGTNGHSNNMIAQDISISTPVAYVAQEAIGDTPSDAHSQQNLGVTGARRVLFGQSVSVKEAAKQYTDTAKKPLEKPPLFSKPPSLNNKLNGRELIEKQKNWISHFASTPVKKPGSPEKQSKGFAVQPKPLEVDSSVSPKNSPLSSPSKSITGSENVEQLTESQPFSLTPPILTTPVIGLEEPDESLSSTSDYNGSTTTTTSQNTIVEVPPMTFQSLSNTTHYQNASDNSSGQVNGETGLVRGGSIASILDEESFLDDTLSLISVSTTPVSGLDLVAEEFKGSEEIEVMKEVVIVQAEQSIEQSIEIVDETSAATQNTNEIDEKFVQKASLGNETSEEAIVVVKAADVNDIPVVPPNNCIWTPEFTSGVQIVEERLKDKREEEEKRWSLELEDSFLEPRESSTDELVVDGLEQQDIQNKKLPEVPTEETTPAESRLLDDLDSTMGTNNSGSKAIPSLFSEFSESSQVTSSSFLVESGKEVYYENGVHYLEDGHYWIEVPGIPGSDEDEDYFDQNIVKKQPTRVRFSIDPMKVYTTFSVSDYDRRNEDVDPAAAAAEYELEKRVEKMEVFPVDLLKGPEGLGLSIIGMGVGADAGLEKLGIFVKTITDYGAAAKDGRIMVNDQIIEVDGKSLVGVTQAYAASVLRSTAGLVKFMIGRENDPENSEVAQLIRQSLQADKEREERRKFVENQFNYSPRGPPPPPPPFEESLRHLAESGRGEVELNEKLQVAHSKAIAAEKEVELLKKRLLDLESNVVEKESYEIKIKEMNERVAEFEEIMKNAQMEVVTYQSMLQESQGQYCQLEKKYQRVKQIVRTLQHRERDLTHRQEFQIQRIHQRDTEYHDLLKSLKERVIQLEQELIETQRRAGLNVPHSFYTHFPATLPTPLTLSLPPPLPPIDLDLSDEDNLSELSDHEPMVSEKKDSNASIKEEFDSAVPQHSLLDISAGKAKAGLAARGGLAGRQAPSVTAKRPNSEASNHSLDLEGAISPEMLREDSRSHLSPFLFSSPPVSPSKSNTSAVSDSHGLSSSPSSFNSSFLSATSPLSASQQSKSSIGSSTKDKEPESIFPYFVSSANNNNSSFKKSIQTVVSSTPTSSTNIVTEIHSEIVQKRMLVTEVGQIPPPAKYAHSEISGPVHFFNRSYSPDKVAALAQMQQAVTSQQHPLQPINSTPQQNHSQPMSTQQQYTIPAHSHYNHPPATLTSPHFHTTSVPKPPAVHLHHAPSPLTEQLRQVLADREKHGHVSGQQHQQVGHSGEEKMLLPPPRRVIADHWQGKKSDTESSNTSIGSNMSSPRIDTNPSPKPEKWMNLSPIEWSNEQVCQYLLFMNMEHLIPPFMDHGITGVNLLQMESKDFKAFGVNGEDKLKMKKKVKELKSQVEKEKKQIEKQKKEQEKLQKKSEKQKSVKK